MQYSKRHYNHIQSPTPTQRCWMCCRQIPTPCDIFFKVKRWYRLKREKQRILQLRREFGSFYDEL